jgi:hypothetical protein
LISQKSALDIGTGVKLAGNVQVLQFVVEFGNILLGIAV